MPPCAKLILARKRGSFAPLDRPLKRGEIVEKRNERRVGRSGRRAQKWRERMERKMES